MQSTTYILTARLQAVNVLSIFYKSDSAGTHFGSCGIHFSSLQVTRAGPTRLCPKLQLTTKVFPSLSKNTCPFAGHGHTFSETDNINVTTISAGLNLIFKVLRINVLTYSQMYRHSVKLYRHELEEHFV